MATLVTLGLSKILGKEGEPTVLNFTETGYTAFGLTYEDTCKMSQEDPEVTEFYAEEAVSYTHLSPDGCRKVVWFIFGFII